MKQTLSDIVQSAYKTDGARAAGHISLAIHAGLILPPKRIPQALNPSKQGEVHDAALVLFH